MEDQNQKPKFRVVIQGPPGLTRSALSRVVFESVVSVAGDAELFGDSTIDVPAQEASLWLATHPIDVQVFVDRTHSSESADESVLEERRGQ